MLASNFTWLERRPLFLMLPLFLQHRALFNRKQSAPFSTNTIRMTDNSKTMEASSSGGERPLKRARRSSRATEALKNVWSVLKDMERELEEAKTQTAKLRNQNAEQTAEFQQKEKELKDCVLELNVRFEGQKEEVRLQREHCAKNCGEMEAKYARLVTAAKAVVGSKLKESGEKVEELEEALMELGATEETEI